MRARDGVISPVSRLKACSVDILAEPFFAQGGIAGVHFHQRPAIVATDADLIVTLPSRVARLFSSTHHYAHALPLETPPLMFDSIGTRNEGDRGHTWIPNS